MWDGDTILAAALDTPMGYINALGEQNTPMIPLGLMAAVGIADMRGSAERQGHAVLHRHPISLLTYDKRVQQVMGYPAAVDAVAAHQS